MGDTPDLVVRIAANITALKADMASAAATLKAIEEAQLGAAAASASHASALDHLGQGWVARIAEGQLLRDAVREVLHALKEMADFLPEIAMRGSVVGDVEQGFAHLAAQAGLTSEVLLTTLRAGTHGTIDDFALMQRANKDLAAGLNLTDAQFGTLAQGAFALAKVTGGSAKDALDSMSDAMVTGKAKAIALLTGKVDLKVAEEAYAIALGGTTANLTAEQKLDADRGAILEKVQAALVRVGAQQDSLKDKVTQAGVAWENFKDELGKQIAQSPVIAAGFEGIHQALAAAFGTDQAGLITTIAGYVNQLAILVIDVGLGMVEAARVGNVAWSAIEVVVLGVETAVVGLVTGIGEVLLKAEQLAGKLHLVDPSEVKILEDTQVGLRAMTVSLAAETAEAAKGVIGHSAFDATLNKVGGALLVTRDAMIAAAAAHTAAVEPIEKVATATAHVGTELKLTAAEIKQLAALVAKTAEENTVLWDEYTANVVKASGTATDISLANLKRLSDDMTAKRIAAGTDDADYYALRTSLDRQATDAILVDHARVAKGSIEALQQEAAKQQATLEDMLTGQLTYSRAAIDAQRAVRDAAVDAMHGYGDAAVAAHTAAAAAAKTHADELLKIVNAAKQARDAMMAMGSTQDLAHAARDPRIMELLHAGWSLENAMAIKMGQDWGYQAKLYSPKGALESQPDPSERVPGYKAGGPTTEGPGILHANEFVVPEGGSLVLHSDGPDAGRAEWDRLNAEQGALWVASGRVVTAAQQKIIDLMRPLTPEGFGEISRAIQPVAVTVNMTVNGLIDPTTSRTLATAVSAELTRQMKQSRLYPAA